MAIPKKIPTSGLDAIKKLVMTNPSARDLYGTASRLGVKPDELLEAIKREGFNARQPQLAVTKGIIPLPRILPADPNTSGYLGRSAEELAKFIKTKARNRKLLIGGGLAGLLALASYTAFSDKPEDKYKKEVERLMQSHRIMNY